MTRSIGARFALAGALVLGAALGCGGPPTPVLPGGEPIATAVDTTQPSPPRSDFGVLLPSPVLSEEEICRRPDAKPAPHEFKGLLRGVKCEQQMYLTMANVATQLGVKCVHCHAKTPGGGDTDLDYPVMTPKKLIANWMTQHLMQAVRPKKAGKYDCASCHRDDKGQPVAKILGNPRDQVRANEWMNLVLRSQFTDAKGAPLKCRSCHVGMPSSNSWTSKVLLQSAQIPEHLSP